MHHNAKPPCVGLPTGLASGPKAVWTGSPVLYLLNTPYAGDPATSRYVKSTVGPSIGSNLVNPPSAHSVWSAHRLVALLPSSMKRVAFQLFFTRSDIIS